MSSARPPGMSTGARAYCMPPQVLHCWSYGQGRWRGHHWQWPRPRLDQYQHLNPCSGCPRCSDAMTPTCRRRPSALAVDVRYSTVGQSCMLQVERRTQHNPLSASFNREHASIARSQMPDAYSKAHLVVQRFVIVNDPMTRATRRTQTHITAHRRPGSCFMRHGQGTHVTRRMDHGHGD